MDIASLLSNVPQWAYLAIAAALAAFKGKDLAGWVKAILTGGKVVPWDNADIVDVLRRVLEELLAKVAGTDPRWQQVADKVAEALAIIFDIKRNPSPQPPAPSK